jgi:hypothetical protein
MAFIVEDGTGKSDANAYLAVADANAYWADHGNPAAWTGANDATKELGLRAAADFLDRQYAGCWRGDRSSGTQRLAWPRLNVWIDGHLLSAAPLPRELREAAAELAYRHVVSGDLMPDVADPSRIVSESVSVGPISKSVTYAGGKAVTAYRRTVESLVAPLLRDPDVVGRG